MLKEEIKKKIRSKKLAIQSKETSLGDDLLSSWASEYTLQKEDIEEFVIEEGYSVRTKGELVKNTNQDTFIGLNAYISLSEEWAYFFKNADGSVKYEFKCIEDFLIRSTIANLLLKQAGKTDDTTSEEKINHEKMYNCFIKIKSQLSRISSDDELNHIKKFVLAVIAEFDHCNHNYEVFRSRYYNSLVINACNGNAAFNTQELSIESSHLESIFDSIAYEWKEKTNRDISYEDLRNLVKKYFNIVGSEKKVTIFTLKKKSTKPLTKNEQHLNEVEERRKTKEAEETAARYRLKEKEEERKIKETILEKEKLKNTVLTQLQSCYQKKEFYKAEGIITTNKELIGDMSIVSQVSGIIENYKNGIKKLSGIETEKECIKACLERIEEFGGDPDNLYLPILEQYPPKPVTDLSFDTDGDKIIIKVEQNHEQLYGLDKLDSMFKTRLFKKISSPSASISDGEEIELKSGSFSTTVDASRAVWFTAFVSRQGKLSNGFSKQYKVFSKPKLEKVTLTSRSLKLIVIAPNTCSDVLLYLPAGQATGPQFEKHKYKSDNSVTFDIPKESIEKNKIQTVYFACRYDVYKKGEESDTQYSAKYKHDIEEYDSIVDSVKKKRLAKKIIIPSFSVLAVATIAFFLFAFIIPLLQLQVTYENINDSEVLITGLKTNANANLAIPSKILQKKTTKIADNAFKNSDKLKVVTIPNTVNSIGKSAFADCPNLIRIIINGGEPPALSGDILQGTDEAKIFIQEASFAAYLSDRSWQKYEDIIFPITECDTDKNIVYFYANGGDGSNILSNVLDDSAVSLPQIPVKPGYSFDGWYKKINGILSEKWEASSIVSGDIKLFAKWALVDYPIEFILNGGVNNVMNSTTSYNIESGYIALYAPTREGYIFEAWCKDAALNESITIIAKGSFGNLSLYAKWEAKSYTIMLEANGGILSNYSMIVKTGEAVDLPVPKTPLTGEFATGHVFDGWYAENNAGNGYGIIKIEWAQFPALGGKVVSLTIYAKWVSASGWYDFNNNTGIIMGLTQVWEDKPEAYKNSLSIPNTIGGMNVTGISENAFKNRTTIIEVVLSEHITEIPENAFSGCVNLELVRGKNIDKIGKDAFVGTKFIDKGDTYNNPDPLFVTVGKVIVRYIGLISVSEWRLAETGATTIGPDAFRNYAKAIDVAIPSSFSINDNAFAGSSIKSLQLSKSGVSLTALYGGSISTALKTVAIKGMSGAFTITLGTAILDTFQCDGNDLTSIVISGTGTIKNALLYKNSLASVITGDIQIGELNLTGNKLSSFDITNIMTYKLMLVGNGVTTITCSAVNNYIGVIFMPADPGDGYTRKNQLNNLNAFVANLPNLVSLDIANNNVSNISGIQSCTNLQELYLGGNPVIGNGGLSVLASISTTTCLKIKRLNLGANSQILAAYKNQILTFVKRCSNLKWIQIYGIGASVSDITSTFIKASFQSLAYLKITHNGTNNFGFNSSETTSIVNHFTGWLVKGQGLIIDMVNGGESNG